VAWDSRIDDMCFAGGGAAPMAWNRRFGRLGLEANAVVYSLSVVDRCASKTHVAYSCACLVGVSRVDDLV
jgi:hypothetical protein